ncbi:uncharacterized protein LOC104582113 [Brachypodium distachyon]|uniref:uncharacterized protein LOC104582113 n=1 Tax=Brachypodium distachyon TaxID=15368 RepID=UPI00053001C1|nr:uncharacterized protein LOC104582113 [Brachypodium distachyon]|eukprot:XP_010229750.1 uncharacterized protein LOC104582113 [Brachypodium distachyon]
MRTKAARDRVRRFQEKKAKTISEDQFLSDEDSEDCKELQFPSDDGGVELVQVHVPPKRKTRVKKEHLRIWYDEEKPLAHTQFVENLCFKDVHQFRRALKNYHIKNKRDYAYLRNDKDRVMVCCKYEGPCPFYLVSSQIDGEDTHCLRVCVEPHTCGITQESFRINSAWLARVFEENVRSDPDYKVQSMIDTTMRKFGVEISKQMAYRARARAQETVINNNPGSRAIVTTIQNLQANPRFHGLFYMLNAQKEGFLNGCRPFIGVDGCFIKLTTGAQVLAASGRDGNNNLFPLAFGVVDKEDTPS